MTPGFYTHILFVVVEASLYPLYTIMQRYTATIANGPYSRVIILHFFYTPRALPTACPSCLLPVLHLLFTCAPLYLLFSDHKVSKRTVHAPATRHVAGSSCERPVWSAGARPDPSVLRKGKESRGSTAALHLSPSNCPARSAVHLHTTVHRQSGAAGEARWVSKQQTQPCRWTL